LNLGGQASFLHALILTVDHEVLSSLSVFLVLPEAEVLSQELDD
jgi:hypothetical protein